MPLSPATLRRAAALALALAACAAPAAGAAGFEPNDTEATAAGPLLSGKTYRAGIESEGDKDFYVLYTSGPGTVELTTANDSPKGCFGPETYVFDSTGKRVGKAHAPAQRTERISFTAPGAARYVVRVTPYYIEPCAPAETEYRLLPRGPLTDDPPGPAKPGPGTGTGGGDGKTPGGTGDGTDGSGDSGDGGTGSALRSPVLRLTSAKRAGSRLRLKGRARKSAAGAKVRIKITGRSGGRTATARRTVRVGAAGRWSASLKLSRTLRRARRLKIAVTFVNDGEHRSATVRKTVKRKA